MVLQSRCKQLFSFDLLLVLQDKLLEYFYIACKGGLLDEMEDLKKNPSFPKDDAIHDACKKGRLEVVRALASPDVVEVYDKVSL